jgi:hypothetical protein
MVARDPNDLPPPALELDQYSTAPRPRMGRKPDGPQIRLRLRQAQTSIPPKVTVHPERREVEITFGLNRYRPGPALIRIKRAVDRDLERLPRDNTARIAEVTKPYADKLAWPMMSCELARLRALGLITKKQFEAGVEYIKLLRDYRAAIDAPILATRPSLVEREGLWEEAKGRGEDTPRETPWDAPETMFEMGDFSSGFVSELQHTPPPPSSDEEE